MKLVLSLCLALLNVSLFAAAPPPLWRQIFTTNVAPFIKSSDGSVAVSSNAANGVWDLTVGVTSPTNGITAQQGTNIAAALITASNFNASIYGVGTNATNNANLLFGTLGTNATNYADTKIANISGLGTNETFWATTTMSTNISTNATAVTSLRAPNFHAQSPSVQITNAQIMIGLGSINGNGGGITNLGAANINATSGSTPGQILTATANGAAWSNAPAGGDITTSSSNNIINLASNSIVTTSNALQSQISAGGLPATNGTGSTMTMYGVNVFPGTVQASNLIVTNMSVDTMNVSTLTVTNGITASNGNFSAAVLSTAASASNSPAANELPTAQWVRSLFNNGLLFYASTNIAVATNTDSVSLVYKLQSTIPDTASRTYTAVTNNQYLGAVVTTNTFSFIQGPIEVNSFLERTGGSGGPSVTVHPEIYFSYDKTNWFGDYEAANQSITTLTNLYQWVISFPAYTSTNPNGFYIERRFKVGAATGATTPNVVFHVGTNFVSGVNNAAHLSFSGPNSGNGNAYLANNQTFTGTNTFTSTVQLSNTTVIQSALDSSLINYAPVMVRTVNGNMQYLNAGTPFIYSNSVVTGAGGVTWNVDTLNATNLIKLATTNDLAGAPSNIVVNMDVPCTRIVVTNNITLTNFVGLAVGTSKVKTLILDVTIGGPWSILYPSNGLPSYGLYWHTNSPPAIPIYSSLTNGSKYILTLVSWDTNLSRSMYECK